MMMKRRTLVFAPFFVLLAVVSSRAQDPICAEIATARSVYGSLLAPAEAIIILDAVVSRHADRYALLAAPPGGNGGLHESGRRVRLDKIVRRADRQILDVFVDGPDSVPGQPLRSGTAGPGCGTSGFAADGLLVSAVGVPPLPVPNSGTPIPNPGTPAPNQGVDDLKAELDALVSLLGELDARLSEIRIQISDIQAQQAKDRADVLALVEQLSADVEEQKPSGTASVIKNLLLFLSAIGAGVGAAK